MIEVYIFCNMLNLEGSELVGIVPFDDFTRWFNQYQFDLSCSYTFHFVKDGKIVENL